MNPSRRGLFGLLAGVAAAPLVGVAKPLFDYGPGPKIVGVDYAVGEARTVMATYAYNSDGNLFPAWKTWKVIDGGWEGFDTGSGERVADENGHLI